MAALNAGEDKITELVARYGADTVTAYMCYVIAYAERRMRAEMGSRAPSQLEERPRDQQRPTGDEKNGPRCGLARAIRQPGTLGFGEDGPHQWHFLLRARRVRRSRVARRCRLARGRIRGLREIERGPSKLCRCRSFARCRRDGRRLYDLHRRRHGARRFGSFLARQLRR